VGEHERKDRYRAEIRRRGTVLYMFATYEVDLVTTHEIQSLPTVDPLFPESRLLVAHVVVGEWWANWKGRRLVAAAIKRDVREAQPWVVTG
jgi:hypothetical protein